MLLFGEGTAGDGNRVLPFRTALIGAARDAIASAGNDRVWIQPLSIAYVSQQGIPLGRHLRPRAAWYGKMKLTDHIGEIVRDWRGRRVGDLGRADRLRRRDRPQDLGASAGIGRAAHDRRGAARRRRPHEAHRGRFIWRQKALRQRQSLAIPANFTKIWNELAGQSP